MPWIFTSHSVLAHIIRKTRVGIVLAGTNKHVDKSSVTKLQEKKRERKRLFSTYKERIDKHEI